MSQRRQLAFQQAGRLWRQRHRHWRQKRLGWDIFLVVLQHQLLEQHPLVRRVLIDQVQPIWPLGDEIGCAHLPDET